MRAVGVAMSFRTRDAAYVVHEKYAVGGWLMALGVERTEDVFGGFGGNSSGKEFDRTDSMSIGVVACFGAVPMGFGFY